jgi:hypothetical protein
MQLAASQKELTSVESVIFLLYHFSSFHSLSSILSSLSSPYIAPDFPFYREHALIT